MCHITLCQTTVHLVSLHSLQMQIVLVSNYSALIGEWSFVMSMCVCFVYLQSYLWNYTSNLHQIFLHVTYGRGLVLLCGLMIHVKVKVKFSHTRYRALGPELIPVYRQSARR